MIEGTFGEEEITVVEVGDDAGSAAVVALLLDVIADCACGADGAAVVAEDEPIPVAPCVVVLLLLLGVEAWVKLGVDRCETRRTVNREWSAWTPAPGFAC